ncbi:antibiotic biosynthesis monooxygenase [Streptomyces sp. TLI_171]|uniref:antibiotic biosynthesis monooxygenase family protein n=1 Tax=Streptomyces sp. TLI_171 TaxID=1938859 RepID=UPI000C1888D1|nr:antibiotic biosynthesis monooxygenase [Streptomyces sp. TLI_171]
MTIPWSTGPAARQPPARPVVMAAELQVRGLRHVPGFLLRSLAVRRHAQQAPGALGVSLRAAPLRRTFWVLSSWTDREALTAFVRSDPHRRAMTSLRPVMAHSAFATWDAPDPAAPQWPEADRQLEAGRAA